MARAMQNVLEVVTKRLTLQQLRRRQALAVSELAMAAEVSRATIWHIECEKVTPNLKTVRKLAKALQVAPDAIAWPGDPLGLDD